MPLATRPAAIDLLELIAIRIEAVGIDAREGADAAARRPSAGAFAIGHRNAFAAFDQRPHFATGDEQRFKRLHEPLPPPTTIASPRIGCLANPRFAFQAPLIERAGLPSRHRVGAFL